MFATGMQSSQRVESNHSFFKKFFQLCNTLLESVVGFEAGLRAQMFCELRANFKDKDTNPIFEIERIMASNYSLISFRRYSDELVESQHFWKAILECVVSDEQVYVLVG